MSFARARLPCRRVDDAPIATCTSCGTELPRSEMFGLEPDLQCPDCAQQIRVRTFVRFRPLGKEYKPVVTVASLLICVLLFLAFQQIKNSGAERFPAWYAALLQNGFIWSGELWRDSRNATAKRSRGAWP